MRIPRIYLPQQLAIDQTVEFDERTRRHVAQVLRLKPGYQVTLFNGDGGEYSAQLETCTRRRVTAQVVEYLNKDTESPLQIHLALGISRGEHMDFAIQKAVELGVSVIIPLLTEHSVIRLEEERANKRLAHWQGVITSACEQCGRNRLPECRPIQTWQQWQENPPDGMKLILHPTAETALGSLSAPAQPVTVLIGPEGGLSDIEFQQALASGFTGIRFGPRVLRTETAAAAAMTALQVLWGDLGAETSEVQETTP